MIVPPEIRNEIIAHSRQFAPNQACGLVLFDDADTAREVCRADNHGAWPYGFQIAPQSQFAAFQRADRLGWRVGGVYHCHVVSEARPTGRDLKRPVPPGMLYLIASLLDDEAPSVRAYLFEAGAAREIELDFSKPTGGEK